MTWVGPYLAENKYNDTSIFQHIIKTNGEDIRSWLSEDDIAIVDRRFRDALPLLEKLSMQAEKPLFLEKGQKQMNTGDANISRRDKNKQTNEFIYFMIDY